MNNRVILFLLCLGVQWAWAGEEAVTIMPLGDSITEGGAGMWTYRYPLMERLRAEGYQVEYVGKKKTQSQRDSPLGELRHEGYSGQNVATLARMFRGLYQQNPADIILLHAGHNNSSETGPIPGMLAATRSIIEEARALNPGVTVLLAQVIPSGKLPKYEYIPEFNAAVSRLASEMESSASPIIVVDHATGFDVETDTVDDKVHPSRAGAKKMADTWFETLKKILPRRAPTPPGPP